MNETKKIKYNGGTIWVEPTRIDACDKYGNEEGPFESVEEAEEWIDERE